MKPQIGSLADLAKIAGVSVSTVSRSLAGNPAIRTETRERIVGLARDHGFRINQAARNLRLGRTGAIGVVLPLGHEADQSLSDPFFMSLLGPIADALSARGHDLLLTRVIPEDGSWLDEIVDAGRCDGVILIGQSDQVDVIESVAARYRPLVVWGAGLPGMAQLTVGTDNVAGGRIAAEHLLARGRRRLAFFGNPNVPEFAARYEGFRQAIAASGVADGIVLPVHLTTDASAAAIADYLADQPPPDGIFAASDVIAMSALSVLAARGVAVPEDVSVVGYDDVLLARYTSPPLTTIRQDVQRGGAALVEQLFARLGGQDGSSVSMAPELVVRGTS